MFVIIFKFCYNTFSSKTILHLSSLLLRYFQIKSNLVKLQILGQIKTSKEISFHPKINFLMFLRFHSEGGIFKFQAFHFSLF